MKKILLSLVIVLLSAQVNSQGVDKPRYLIQTYRLSNYLGAIEIELYPIIAPLHTAMFDSLVNVQFFDSTAFHRVVPGFVIQGGDPNSISGPINTWGQGQPWQPTVPAEFNPVRHVRGTIGAARDTDPNSATSQFYICVGSPTYLDNNYTVYGRVTSGLNIVDSIATSARDANDVPLQKISMFISSDGFNSSVPAVPVLNLPADSATSVLNTQSFSWAAVDSAVLYTIQFSTDSLFNTISFSDTLALPQLTFLTMQGLTEYFWRVRSNNGGHESAWSDIRRFTSTTGAATGVYPADASTGIPVNLNFIWNSVPAATSYVLQVSTTPVFSGAALIYNQAGIIDTTQLVTGLTPNRVYYWRIQSENNGLPGMYSAKYYFNTGTSTGLSENNNGAIMNGPWPNPVKDIAAILVISKTNQPYQLRLHDLSGRTLLNQKGFLQSGENNLSIDLSDFISGIYLFEIQIDNARSFRQLVKE